MSIDSDKLKEAKQALKAMSPRGRGRLTKQGFVTSLIREIHAKMEAGFKLSEICEEVNKSLPEGSQMKESTFRAYVRNARKEEGIEALKKWTRRTDKEGETETVAGGSKADKVSKEAKNKSTEKTSTADDYRHMGDL